MTLLIIGLLIWYGAHLFKRAAPGIREPMGEKGKGPVALAILVSVALMIIGYRMTGYSEVWARPSWGTHLNNLLMVFAVYLVTPGPSKGALLHKMRHPMLTGFLIWTVAHLLVNGDVASIVLFGGLGVWAIVEMIVINRSEANWTPHPKGTVAKDGMFFAISILLVGVIGYIHTFFGLVPFGG